MSTFAHAQQQFALQLPHTETARRLRKLYESATDPKEREMIGWSFESVMVTCPLGEVGQMREAWEGC